MAVSAPVPLAPHHDVSLFECGEESLDQWLKRRAYTNQLEGATRTFVACDEHRVIGYYALAAGSVAAAAATGRFRRNMPDPVPVIMLARLAVDRSFAGQGIGRGLIQDAARRISNAADAIGVRGVCVHPISPSAREFYQRVGFVDCPGDGSMMVVTLRDLRAALQLP